MFVNNSENGICVRIEKDGAKTRPKIPQKNVDMILNMKNKVVKQPSVPLKKQEQQKGGHARRPSTGQ